MRFDESLDDREPKAHPTLAFAKQSAKTQAFKVLHISSDFSLSGTILAKAKELTGLVGSGRALLSLGQYPRLALPDEHNAARPVAEGARGDAGEHEVSLLIRGGTAPDHTLVWALEDPGVGVDACLGGNTNAGLAECKDAVAVGATMLGTRE